MTMLSQLETFLGKKRIRIGEPLSQYTTLGVGGPAQFFFEAGTGEELVGAVRAAKKLNLPYFILGSGSNLVVADKGTAGLVIKNRFLDFSCEPFRETFRPRKIPPRLQPSEPQKYLDTQALPLSFNKKSDKKFLVRVGSGWKLGALIQKCLEENLVGLEWFAGIPGSIGGAVYMNIHGGSYFFSDFVYQVKFYDSDREKTQVLKNQELKFAYDFSLFQKKPWVILAVELVLYRGNVEVAKKTRERWLGTKLRVQPQRSCGSVWQNLSAQERLKLGLPTPSIGYLIEKHLGLKGKQIGQAQISTKHAGFIENLGKAKASDVLELIRLVEAEARKTGITLRREIIVVGEE